MPDANNLNVETLLGLLLVIFIVAVIMQRVRLPYTVALVVVGVGLALIPEVGHASLTPDLILTVFLPILLFEGAYNVPAKRLRRNLVPVVALAVPGVLLGMGVIATIVHFAFDLSWSVSLLFGALISATDPVAVLSMFKEFGVPRRLAVIVEGESLFNDGTAFTLFQILLVAVVAPQQFDFGAGVLDFFITVAGALVVGTAIGYGGSLVLRAIDNYQIEITATVIAAYGGYLLADHLGYSGVIATVMVGLFFGNFGTTTGVSPSTIRALGSTWEWLAFVVNSLIFLLIGLQLSPQRFASTWQYILIAFVAMQVARAVVVWVLTPMFRGELKIPWRYRPVLFWGGLRGALSLALVLSLPYVTGSGDPFPDRALLELMTFGVVGLSLLVQGLTMPPLIHKLGFVQQDSEPQDEFEVTRGRLIANEAALIHLAKQHERHEISDLEYERYYSSYQRQHEHIARRLSRLQQVGMARDEEMATDEEAPVNKSEAAEDRARAEKEALHTLYEQGDISGHTLDTLEEEVDSRLQAENEAAKDET